jgi:hypothetical protein
MDITKEMFLDWKKHPVTMLIYKILADNIDEGHRILEYDDSDKVRGKIIAYRDLLNIEFSDTQGE